MLATTFRGVPATRERGRWHAAVSHVTGKLMRSLTFHRWRCFERAPSRMKCFYDLCRFETRDVYRFTYACSTQRARAGCRTKNACSFITVYIAICSKRLNLEWFIMEINVPRKAMFLYRDALVHEGRRGALKIVMGTSCIPGSCTVRFVSSSPERSRRFLGDLRASGI